LALTLSALKGVNAAIQDYVIPRVHDITYRDTDLVTLWWLNKNCRSTKFKAGKGVRAPVVAVEADDSVQLTDGDELIPTDRQTELDQVEYQWHLRAKPVVGTIKDIKMHCGNAPNLVFPFWKNKVKIAAKQLRKKVAYQILNNSTTDSATTGYIAGLRLICGDYTTSSVTAYGGITIGASGDTLDAAVQVTDTTLTLGGMNDQWVNCNNKTEFIVTTPTQWSKYWKLVQPQQRFADGDTAKAGFKNLLFNTAPVVFDTQCPSGDMYFLAAGDNDEKYLYYFVHPSFDFAYEDTAKSLPNQAIQIARFYHGMQLLAPGRRYQGLMGSLT
jgi:hypothetical protein